MGAWGGGVSIKNGVIEDSVVSGNTTQAPPASPYQEPPPASQLAGGGIYATPDWGLDILRCTVSGNTAPRGGGILVEDASYLNLVNSTVSGNSATGNGGGIFIDWDWNFSSRTARSPVTPPTAMATRAATGAGSSATRRMSPAPTEPGW